MLSLLIAKRCLQPLGCFCSGCLENDISSQLWELSKLPGRIQSNLSTSDTPALLIPLKNVDNFKRKPGALVIRYDNVKYRIVERFSKSSWNMCDLEKLCSILKIFHIKIDHISYLIL